VGIRETFRSTLQSQFTNLATPTMLLSLDA
jgi:hypothetical protein